LRFSLMACYTRATGILALMIHTLAYKNVARHVKKRRENKIKQISLSHVQCALSYVESTQCDQRYRDSQRVFVKCDSNASSCYFCLQEQRKITFCCLSRLIYLCSEH